MEVLSSTSLRPIPMPACSCPQPSFSHSLRKQQASSEVFSLPLEFRFPRLSQQCQLLSFVLLSLLMGKAKQTGNLPSLVPKLSTKAREPEALDKNQGISVVYKTAWAVPSENIRKWHPWVGREVDGSPEGHCRSPLMFKALLKENSSPGPSNNLPGNGQLGNSTDYLVSAASLATADEH